MNIEALDKIKHNINPKFSELFFKEDIETKRFIPINKQSDFFFIAVCETTNKTEITSFVSTKITETLKIISIDKEKFDELLSYYLEMCFAKTSPNELKASCTGITFSRTSIATKPSTFSSIGALIHS